MSTTPTSDYHRRPESTICGHSLQYNNCDVSTLTVDTIARLTPKPKGRPAFSSIHLVHSSSAPDLPLLQSTDCHKYSLPDTKADAVCEYNAIFDIASQMILAKADRASLLIFVGDEAAEQDGFGGIIGMLPFRGIHVALVTSRQTYGSPHSLVTPSGAYEFKATDAGRMGMFPVQAMFGSLPSKRFEANVDQWDPIAVSVSSKQEEMVELPFKIGSLKLPMVTYKGEYDQGVSQLADEIERFYSERDQRVFPIVSCGETVDAIGYGSAIQQALAERDCPGYYFAHRSGETFKCYEEYGRPELLRHVAASKAEGKKVVFIAVGGGVNGNCIGLVAAITGADFIEVPTTPMHYNDATTSAKKAFSLVVDGKILSKNILGAFYLPRLVFCINDCMLTCSSSSIHATVGEATKTMNMLGIADSTVGQRDYHNILGAFEFASDFTKILLTVEGFEQLIEFIKKDDTVALKNRIVELGAAISSRRETSAGAWELPRLSPRKRNSSFDVGMPRNHSVDSNYSSLDAELQSPMSPDSRTSSRPSTPDSSSSLLDSSSSCHDDELTKLEAERQMLLREFQQSFHSMPAADKNAMQDFLATINLEVVKAKAMFLSYSDPFEKYRALLFEYAHTLGHGVEAFMNGLYQRARAEGINYDAAIRQHGQCVGMAVQWAGQMSAALGKLSGEGLTAHQSLVYLFNAYGEFSFAPLRQLMTELGVSKEEFVEGVLAVVRRDNKRGYTNCDCCKSVDQLVTDRPGKMMKSADPNAELRYLVEVDEAWQAQVLEQAFEGAFDRVADIQDGSLVFQPLETGLKRQATAGDIAAKIHRTIRDLYSRDLCCQACEI